MLDGLPEQRYLKISIQEPEQQGINRWVQVELASHGENVIRVQSISESWAIGKAESLLTYLRPFQRGLVTQFRKFGLSLNVLITMVTLAALPGLSGFWPRLAFAFSILGLQTVFAYLHGKIVPNFLL